jgi:hypothetical protein
MGRRVLNPGACVCDRCSCGPGRSPSTSQHGYQATSLQQQHAQSQQQQPTQVSVCACAVFMSVCWEGPCGVGSGAEEGDAAAHTSALVWHAQHAKHNSACQHTACCGVVFVSRAVVLCLCRVLWCCVFVTCCGVVFVSRAVVLCLCRRMRGAEQGRARQLGPSGRPPARRGALSRSRHAMQRCAALTPHLSNEVS